MSLGTSYAEAITASVAVFGDGNSKEIKLNGVIK
jgi:hypothetical protein